MRGHKAFVPGLGATPELRNVRVCRCGAPSQTRCTADSMKPSTRCVRGLEAAADSMPPWLDAVGDSMRSAHTNRRSE
jgi:hypothetical protein